MTDKHRRKGNLDAEACTQGKCHLGLQAKIKLYFYNQGPPKIASKPSEAQSGLEHLPPHITQKNRLADTLISDF